MLSKYGLAPSRERGQNFLVDRNVARKMVDAVGADRGDVVVEIGPGFGAITFGLVEAAARVVAVEYDAGIVRAFREEYGEISGLMLVEGDALRFDLGRVARDCGVERVIVAGNIPYGITSPLVGRLIEERTIVTRAVVMLQREVADRLTGGGRRRQASALSAVVAFHAEVTPLFTVRRTCFHPRPDVDSMVVGIDFQGVPSRLADPDTYSEVVHAAFAGRRKMLRRSLAGLMNRAGVTPAELQERAGIDLRRRAETLSVDEFEAITMALSDSRTGLGSGTSSDSDHQT